MDVDLLGGIVKLCQDPAFSKPEAANYVKIQIFIHNLCTENFHVLIQ